MDVLPVLSITVAKEEQEEINKVNPSLKTGRRVRSLPYKIHCIMFYTLHMPTSPQRDIEVLEILLS